MTAAEFGKLIEEIRLAVRIRRYYHSAEKKLTLQMLAILRAGGLEKADARQALKALDKEIGRRARSQVTGVTHLVTAPALPAVGSPVREVLDRLADMRIALRHWRIEWEKRAEQAAEQLPVWDWLREVAGAGVSTLALVIGETGDLSLYPNPAKLWKRLGVDVWEDGRCRRKVKEKKVAEAMGYNPRRRSVLWNVGANLIRVKGSYYAELYLPRKEYEAARGGCGRGKCGDAEGHCTKGHAHRKAQRYMEKRFVRDLWRAWNAAAGQREAA